MTLTNEQLVNLRRQARLIVIAAAEKEKKKSDIPPPVSESDVTVDITDPPAYNTVGKKHTGPQTVEALMDAFHTNYNKGKLSSEMIEYTLPNSGSNRFLIEVLPYKMQPNIQSI